MKPLAVVMIVKNAELDLEKCFNAFRKNGLEPDFHLFDTGSTDDTIQKAKALGAIVQKLPKVTSFAMSRNSAFHKVLYESIETYKWFMCIDADEEIGTSLAKDIKDFVESEEMYGNYDAAFIHNEKYKEISYDSRLSIVKASLVEDYTLRFINYVHEEIDSSKISRSRIFDIYGEVIHQSNNFISEVDFLRKHYFYFNLAKEYYKDYDNYWFANFLYADLLDGFSRMMKYQSDSEKQKISEILKKSIVLCWREFMNGQKRPSNRYAGLIAKKYLEFHETNNILNLMSLDYLKGFLEMLISKEVYCPNVFYTLSKICLLQSNPKEAIEVLEMMEIKRPKYREDLTFSSEYEANELMYEKIIFISIDFNFKDKVIETWNKLKSLNPSSEFIKRNKEAYEAYCKD